MSHDAGVHPSTWAAFEEKYRKELFPINKKDSKWMAWDKCRMDSLAVTQYISKYREIILRLDGFDDFQKIRDFVCGLDNKYMTKVKM